jgi:hypothetical protein
MLTCIFVAGAFFLSNGVDLVNPDRVWVYRVENGHLLAFGDRYQSMSFDLTTEQKSQTAHEVVSACLNDADRVALASIDDI